MRELSCATKRNSSTAASPTEATIDEVPFDATRVVRLLRSAGGAVRVLLLNTASGAELVSIPLKESSVAEIRRAVVAVRAMRAMSSSAASPHATPSMSPAMPRSAPEPALRIPDPPRESVMAQTTAAASTPVGAILLPPEQATSPKVANASREWSPFQTAIFDFIRNDTGNAVIAAVAGSGKTTTIKEALNYIPEGASVLVCAFNTSIQKELEAEIPKGRGIVVRTLVAHGFSILKEYWSTPFLSPELGDLRDRTVVMEAFGRDRIGGPRVWDVIKNVQKLVGLCESYLALTDDEIRGVMSDYGLFVGTSGTPWGWTYDGGDAKNPKTWRHADVLRWVKNALSNQLTDPAGRRDYGRNSIPFQDASKLARYNKATNGGSTAFISFRDMVFVPAVNKDWKPSQLFDFVFVDETQDMDVAQLEIILRSVAPGGRIIVVGDERQSIYRFRGADTRAIPRMRETLNAKTLPLSVSYRVPQCSARQAQAVLGPDAFQVPPDAPEGTCSQITALQMLQMVQLGDFIITRKNAPILPIALRCIREGLTPYVMGEGNQIPSMLKGTINAIERMMSARNRSMGDFTAALEQWTNQEQQKIATRMRDNIRRWEQRSRRRWQDIEGTIEGDSEYQQIAFMASALWNNEGTGLAQGKSIHTVDDLRAVVDKIAPTEGEVSKMDPAEFKAMLRKRVVISSVHRIKGAEAPRVFVLEETFAFTRRGMSSKRKLSSTEIREEENLWYVAVTRVKYTRANPKKGIPAHDGELFFVRDLERILGRNKAWEDGDDAEDE